MTFCRALVALLVGLTVAMPVLAQAPDKKPEPKYCLYSLQYLIHPVSHYQAGKPITYRDTIRRFPGSLFDIQSASPPKDIVDCAAACEAKKKELMKDAVNDSKIKKDKEKIKSTLFVCRYGEAGNFKLVKQESEPYPPESTSRLPPPPAPSQPNGMGTNLQTR